MTSRREVFNRITKHLPSGQLEWIGLRPERKTTMSITDEALAIPGLGLQGDRRCRGSEGSARQVTLISIEHIQVVEKLLGKSLAPELFRRNLVISGINILALRYQYFTIGEVIFEATALCHPCSRMEETLGKGGHAATLGHGGLCAKIIKGGMIKLGDKVTKSNIEEKK